MYYVWVWWGRDVSMWFYSMSNSMYYSSLSACDNRSDECVGNISLAFPVHPPRLLSEIDWVYTKMLYKPIPMEALVMTVITMLKHLGKFTILVIFCDNIIRFSTEQDQISVSLYAEAERTLLCEDSSRYTNYIVVLLLTGPNSCSPLY